MTEKGGHLNLAQREVEHRKSQLERTEEKLATEKVCLILFHRYEFKPQPSIFLSKS